MSKKKTKFSLHDVKKSIDKRKVTELPAARRFFFQPLADLLTVWFVNSGWTANGVTMLRGVLTLLALLLLPFSHSVQHVQIFAFFILFLITLDFVDGNLARLRDTGTYYGKYWDGYFDFLLPTFLMPSLGFLLAQHNNEPLFSQLGLAYGLASCFLWFTRERVRSFAHFMRIRLFAEENYIIEFETPETSQEARYASFMQSVRNLSYFILLFPDFGQAFFYFTAIYLILCIPPWFLLHFSVVKHYLNRRKVSVLSPRKDNH